MEQPDVSHYAYRVTWSAEDAEFVATCVEFPSLSWLAPTPAGALEGLVDLLREAIADMRQLAERWFAERQEPGLVADGMPAQGIEHLREYLTDGILRNPAATQKIVGIYAARCGDCGHRRATHESGGPCEACGCEGFRDRPVDGEGR